MLKIILVIVLVAVAFVLWRLMSVGRGARRRDERLVAQINPVAKKLEAGEPVTNEEITALAARPELRHLLFAALRHLQRLDLMPTAYASSISQGESALAYWLMHPNELQDAPEAIEFLETVVRAIDGRDADFHVYRYRMATGHWAAKDGWLLGLAGPMSAQTQPYAEIPGAFSRAGDIEGKVTPSDLVDWYVGMLRQKGLIA